MSSIRVLLKANADVTCWYRYRPFFLCGARRPSINQYHHPEEHRESAARCFQKRHCVVVRLLPANLKNFLEAVVIHWPSTHPNLITCLLNACTKSLWNQT